MVKFYLSPRPDKQGECPIRVSVSIRGSRLVSTAGYNIAPVKWNKADQRVKKGHYNADKIPGNIINARLKAIDSHFANYEIGLDHRPSIEELSEQLASVKGTSRRRAGKAKEASTALDYFDRFVQEESRASQWTEGTLMNWRSFRKHLQSFGEDAQLSDFDSSGLSRFIDILRNRENLSEVSAQKEFKCLRWFLRWCIRNGFTKEDAALNYKAKFKTMPKPVIFLTRDELMQLYRYEIPAKGTIVRLTDLNGRQYDKEVTHTEGLQRARDLFCFCAFTSLRYSDAVALRKSDIAGDCIKVVTKKTSDALQIDLNDYSRAILDKHKGTALPFNAALPYLSVHTLDNFIKELGELCGFNEPIARTIFKGGKRLDATQPKWQLLSSHAGRRTFICYALSVGIPPQVVMKWTGHSDYKSMRPYIDITDAAKRKGMQDFNNGMED